jgi:hypothetical protein
MEYSYSFSGSAPIVKKYQIGEAMATAGIPVEIETLSDTAGLLMCETTTCADSLGVTLDAQATRNTAQQTDNSDPAVYVSVIVNPDAVWKAKMSGGSASNTAITTQTNTVADSTGLLTTLALDSAYDNGYIWGYTGANAGVLRKVTAVAGTNEVPIIAFPHDIAVGDTFLAATFGPGALNGCQLTTTLEQVDVTADIQSTDNFRVVEFEVRDSSDSGTTNSFCYLSIFDHLFGNQGA